MNRATRVVMVAALAALASAPASAVTLQGKWGLGYFRPEAPVGGRIWLAEKVGLDAGVGLTSSDATGDDQLGFLVDAGIPLVLHATHQTVFFVRPGVSYASTPDPYVDLTDPLLSDPDNKRTQLWVSGTFGVEHFLGDRFSVQAAHGLVYKNVDPDLNGDSFTEISTEDFGISRIGFHYYFGGE